MFNKNALKDGMVVEFNHGKRRMVWEGKLIDERGFVPMHFINEDLYNIDDVAKEHIIKIYLTHDACYLSAFFNDKYLTCIWTRGE